MKSHVYRMVPELEDMFIPLDRNPMDIHCSIQKQSVSKTGNNNSIISLKWAIIVQICNKLCNFIDFSLQASTEF